MDNERELELVEKVVDTGAKFFNQRFSIVEMIVFFCVMVILNDLLAVVTVHWGELLANYLGIPFYPCPF